jgi:hypothetical protein
MDALRTTPVEETGLHAIAAALLLLAVTGALPVALATVLALLTSGAALSRTLRRHRELARLRAAADEVLSCLPGSRIPDRLQWRAAEIMSRAHRRRLARELRRFARMANDSMLITAVPVFLSTLRPNRRELESMAALVERDDRPVPVRGIVLLEHLLSDVERSPLYGPRQAEELRRALRQVRRTTASSAIRP